MEEGEVALYLALSREGETDDPWRQNYRVTADGVEWLADFPLEL